MLPRPPTASLNRRRLMSEPDCPTTISRNLVLGVPSNRPPARCPVVVQPSPSQNPAAQASASFFDDGLLKNLLIAFLSASVAPLGVSLGTLWKILGMSIRVLQIGNVLGIHTLQFLCRLRQKPLLRGQKREAHLFRMLLRHRAASAVAVPGAPGASR
jgi:hypothetical protein